MTLIDLTDEATLKMPLIGVITRFPPSESGAAPSSYELVRLLRDVHGYPVEVIRLMKTGEGPSGGDPVVMNLHSDWGLSSELAIRRIKRCDAVLIHVDRHVPICLVEDLLDGLDIPVVLSLHDVAPPDSEELRRQGALTGRAATTVVPSETARVWLTGEAPADARIEVVPHGSAWQPFQPRRGPRRIILSWGFIGTGMGAERVCRALGHLRDLRPLPRYRLVGVADPWTSRADVSDYRQLLLSTAAEAGVADQFEMLPYVHSDDDMAREIEHADLIAVVYDADDLSCSRILSEAVTTGRPVVATQFPGAVDMLTGGVGITVPHDDDVALADAIRTYLTDDAEYRRACAAGSTLSSRLSLDAAAERYAVLLAQGLGMQDRLVETPG